MAAPTPTPYQLSLSIQRTQNEVEARTQAFRLRIIATVVSGFNDPGVFIGQQIAGKVAQFTNIASPADLADYGLDTPDPETGYFRTSVLDVVVPNADLITEIQRQVMAEIQTLCNEMFKLETDLTIPDVVVIGNTP